MMIRVFKVAAFVAAFMTFFASCEKQPQHGDSAAVTADLFTASIANLKTTVTVGGNVGKVAWVEGDKITVTDAAGNSAVYEAAESGASVEFTLASGETAIGAGPYLAAYNGETPAAMQIYSADSVPSITMTAESETKDLVFSVTSGLLKLTLSGSSTGNIRSIMVKGDETELYTLSCPEEGVDIASLKDFHIALPAGSFKKIYLTNASGKTCIVTFKESSGFAVEANAIQPVTLSGLSADKFDGVYLGVNADSGYPLLWAEKNVGAATPQDAGYYLGWGNTDSTISNHEDTYPNTQGYKLISDITPDGGCDAARVHMGGAWRLPTQDEAEALVKLTISEADGGWNIAGNGNRIFMPAAGFIKNKKSTGSGYGYFWTSSFATATSAKAIQLRPDAGHKVYGGTRNYGFNVRAVKE